MMFDPTEEDNERYLENFLFTVAAINPSGSVYKGAKELDPAELSRFYSITVQQDPIEHLNYLTKFYNAAIEKEEDPEEKIALQGRLKLAQTILKDPDFYYDTDEEIEELFDDKSYRPLNYRSFKTALDFSDGTKEDFLDTWNHYCNYKKKSMVEQALSDYVDVDDKANQALKDGTESEVFKKRKNNWDKLKSFYGSDID